MVNRFFISPVLCAALGAAGAYYVLGRLYTSGAIGINAVLFVFLLLLVPLCVLRALVSVAAREKIRTLKRISVYAAALGVGMALGLAAGTKAVPVLKLGIPEEKVRGISGVLLEDPRIVTGGVGMALVALREVSGDGGLRVSAAGELPVFFPEENTGRLFEFGRGCHIFSGGALRKNAAGFVSFGAESLHITRGAPFVEKLRTGTRAWLSERFSRQAGGWGALALALLLGIRDNLDTGLAALYRDAGCSHVLALSGMHLAVIGSIIALLLKKPLGKRASALTGACIIGVYCFVVGPLPSLIRAALMYMLGVAVILYSRKRDALSILCMAFIVQIIITPQSALTLSFVLSYLALAGILISGDSVSCIFKGTIPSCLLTPLAASLGAFIFTAAVTVYFFGALRPVGIIAGLVLMPLATIFMTGSLCWLALGSFFPFFSRLLSVPLAALYRLMEQTVRTAARVPATGGLGFPLVLCASTALAICIGLYALVLRAHKNRIPAFG